jgi:hypothetical protein
MFGLFVNAENHSRFAQSALRHQRRKRVAAKRLCEMNHFAAEHFLSKFISIGTFAKLVGSRLQNQRVFRGQDGAQHIVSEKP